VVDSFEGGSLCIGIVLGCCSLWPEAGSCDKFAEIDSFDEAVWLFSGNRDCESTSVLAELWFVRGLVGRAWVDEEDREANDANREPDRLCLFGGRVLGSDSCGCWVEKGEVKLCMLVLRASRQ